METEMETFWRPQAQDHEKVEQEKETQAIEQFGQKFGATRRSRTGDLLITNQLLYQLS